MKTKNPVDEALEAQRLRGEGIAYGLKIVSPNEALLGSMGGAERLLFTVGGAVQVGFYTNEIVRLLEAVGEMEKLKKKPDTELVEALATATRRLQHARRAPTRLGITVPLAVHAVELNPVLAVIGDPSAIRAAKL